MTFLLLLLLAPDCSLFPGSKMLQQPRQYEGEGLYDYIDGNSEGYLLYGFVRMRGVTCEQGAVRYVVDISEFQDAESAYGMFTSTVDARLPLASLGAGGQVLPQKAIFVKDKYYVEVSAEPSADYSHTLQAAAAAIDAKLQGRATPPEALAWFPAEHRKPGTMPRLIAQSVLGLRLLPRGYVGEYDSGKAFVVSAESAAAATNLMAKLKERFGTVQAISLGDEAFLATDKYLGRMCVFRKGARVAGWANTANGEDPAQLASKLAERIR